MDFIDENSFAKTKALFDNKSEFIELTGKLIATLKTAQKDFLHFKNENKTEEIRSLAHSIKSPCKLFGLQLLGDFCAKIEANAVNGKVITDEELKLFNEKSDIAIHFLNGEMSL
jgi:HPt (histidine-containing phosphotransfer) domain-containing protein